MFTGKLEGAWRVDARSLPRRLWLEAFLPGVIGTRPQSGAKNFALQSKYSFRLTKLCNEIDWYYKACIEEHPSISARS